MNDSDIRRSPGQTGAFRFKLKPGFWGKIRLWKWKRACFSGLVVKTLKIGQNSAILAFSPAGVLEVLTFERDGWMHVCNWLVEDYQRAKNGIGDQSRPEVDDPVSMFRAWLQFSQIQFDILFVRVFDYLLREGFIRTANSFFLCDFENTTATAN